MKTLNSLKEDISEEAVKEMAREKQSRQLMILISILSKSNQKVHVSHHKTVRYK